MKASEVRPEDWPPFERLYVGRAEPVPYGGGFGWKITIKNRGGYWQKPHVAEEAALKALQHLLEMMSREPAFNPHLEEDAE